jgi:hypothetical protein
MAVELTPRVSQDTTGLGFQVPVFRMNQGVNAATANPMSRAAMQPMEMVSESQFGLNPNIMAMADQATRSQFFAGVDELNQFVNKAAEFGIDPSKVDMTVPESFALNQEFRKRVQGLQQQARAISSGAAQTALAEREANLAYQQQDRLYQQQQRLEAANDRELKTAEQEEKRLEKGFLKEISGLAPKIQSVLGEQGRQYGAAQSASLRKDKESLIKQLEKKREQLTDDPDNVYKMQRLDEVIESIAGVTTRPEDVRSRTLDDLDLAGGEDVAELGSPLKITSTQSVKPVPVDPTFDTGLMQRGVPSFEATGPISISSVSPRPMYYIDGPGGQKTPFSQEEFDALLPAQKRMAKLGIVGVGTAEFSSKSPLKIGGATSSQKINADVMVVIPEEMYGQVAKAKYPGTSAKAKAQQDAEIKRLKSLTEPKVRFDKALLTQ